MVYISGNEQSGFTVEDHYADPDKSIELLHYEGAEGEPYSILVRNSDEVIGDDQYDETLVGTAGDDMLVGAAGTNIRHDEFYGYTGNDVIDNSDGGLSLVLAGDGNDIVTGGDETDRIHGESGDDTLNGGSGDDRLFGGSGNDLIDGGSGNDTIDGGQGDDVYIFNGLGNDVISDEGGIDTLKFELSYSVNDDVFLGGWQKTFRNNDDLVTEGLSGSVTFTDAFSENGLEYVSWASLNHEPRKLVTPDYYQAMNQLLLLHKSETIVIENNYAEVWDKMI